MKEEENGDDDELQELELCHEHISIPTTNNNNNSQLLGRILSGSIGAIITSFAVTPLEVLKVRQQQFTISSNNVYSNNPAILRCRDCGTFILNNGLMDCVLNKRDVPQHFQQLKDDRWVTTEQMNDRSRKNVQQSNTGIYRLLRNIYKVEGVRGIYAGLGPTLVMSVPNTVLYFTAYDEICYRLKQLRKQSSVQYPEWSVPLISGSSARLIATFTTSPLELLRTRQAALSTVKSRGIVGEMTQIIKLQGFSSLWSGLAPTLWRDVPFSALYWVGVEEIRSNLERMNDTSHEYSRSPLVVAWNSFISGAFAGMMAAFFTAPFDVVKTRIQSQIHDIPSKIVVLDCNHSGATAISDMGTSSSTFRYLLQIGKTEGISSLWRGNMTRMIKVAPACAIMISCYELGKNLIG